MKQVWFVKGEDMDGRYVPTLLATKDAAESYARMMFPDDNASELYARIHYVEVFTVSDLFGG